MPKKPFVAGKSDLPKESELPKESDLPKNLPKESDQGGKRGDRKRRVVRVHPVVRSEVQTEINSEIHAGKRTEAWAVGVPAAKRLGEAVEAAFLAKATMLGIGVAKPWGDSRPYDFIVDCGRRLLWRVQVKCATSYRGSRCEARAAGGGELYTLDDIDFLAAYVMPKNFWYVVPAKAFVPRVTVHFNYGPLSQSMFEIYRETWCLLGCSASAWNRSDVPRRCRCEEMPVRCVVCPKR